MGWCPLAAFGPDFSFTSALLIEDSPKMVSLFESLGGHACRYEGDQALHAWLEENGFTEELQNLRIERNVRFRAFGRSISRDYSGR